MRDENTAFDITACGEALSGELERDARRYDRAFSEEDEVKQR